MDIDVFGAYKIAGIEFKNRIIRSATHEGMGDEDGKPTEKLKKLYVDLAKGGVGGIITGYAGVSQRGKSDNHNMLMIDSDELVDSYRVIVDDIHKLDVPIIMQIAHCGRQTSKVVTGLTPIAPSAIKDKIYNDETPKMATVEEIKVIVDDFVKASLRAQKAGFDAIQLHIAHGYLLSSFLSPYTNRRTDDYGESLENRYKIIDEIIRGIKEVATDFPIFAKLNVKDNRKNGMGVNEARKIAILLEKSGCECIEVSCGVVEDGIYMSRGEKCPTQALLEFNPKFRSRSKIVKNFCKPFIKYVLPVHKPTSNYNVEDAEIIKKAVNIPVIVVGGIRKIDRIKKIISEEKADMVSLSRPFILEKNIVEKLKRENRLSQSA